MKRFLSIGECMIEMAPTDAGTYSMNFAGDTFNTAWYARKLAVPGVEIGYLSAVGDDDPSQSMTRFMADAGITPHLAVRPGGHVGLYMVSLNNGERSFSYWRSTAAARSLAEDLTRLPDLEPGDMAFFSGITLAILPDEGRRHLLEVLAQARSQGIRIAFDPNLRPRLWQDGAEMCHWVSEAAKVADIALPSYEDEAAWFNDVSKLATAERYAAAGASLVLSKDGGDPVLILENGQTTEVAPPKVAQMVDSTAAGDSFNAGFLMGLAAGKSTVAATEQACALAAEVVTKRGALVALDRFSPEPA